MNGNTYTAKVSVELAGEQDVAVDSFKRPAGQTSYISVGIGPVLVYCRSRSDVAVHEQAWTAALDAAGQVFPDRFAAPLPPSRAGALPGFPVIASVTSQPGDSWNHTVWTAGATRDGLPMIVVRVGALTLAARDLAAVTSAHTVWAEAGQVAAIMWAGQTKPTRAETQRRPRPRVRAR